ncbi:hypothetical protein SAMN04488041_102586 [Sulfitobacter pontiacus]|uniref:Uncharacterized protein n=1 Tax=Sulfitobacter pontiacus TaxID=60137 RepID=A0A1H2USF1_9RHOB|nr:hypothetical protein SAMN04488041_102586 [Sulfitobacter pontiacus]
MRTERPAPRLAPATPFERHLIHRHNLPDHWVRTYTELRGGHR